MRIEIPMRIEVKPYRIAVSDDVLDDLKSRLRKTRWPEAELVDDWSQGAPLTNPTAHGGSAADAFHVICPSLPGFGFSAKPATRGWGVDRIASAWAVLMNRLGYDSYGAQGGDWGSAVTTALGAQDPTHCAGIHITLAMGARPNPEGQPTPE